MTAARLLLEHLDLLTKLDHSLPVLDLACGSGRNGLMLAELGIPVVFADRSSNALKTIERYLTENGLPGRTWEVDLEQAGVNPLPNDGYDAIIVFRYLHRPLFPALLNAIKHGGLVIYETFTIGNRQFGRPNNPDFLLQPGELASVFQDWEIIYSFEGMLQDPDRAVARIVARRPCV
jgi:tellurite methyltransferase